jgi:hypothetical protein
MATYGGANYTNFKGVNFKNTAAIRLEMDGGFAGTIAVTPGTEANRQWYLPDMNGKFPIMGTFAVQLPTHTVGTTIESTAVTVAGIRSEDALIVFGNKGVTAGYGFSASTSKMLIAAEAGDGQIILTFRNEEATAYVERIYSYIATR